MNSLPPELLELIARRLGSWRGVFSLTSSYWRTLTSRSHAPYFLDMEWEPSLFISLSFLLLELPTLLSRRGLSLVFLRWLLEFLSPKFLENSEKGVLRNLQRRFSWAVIGTGQEEFLELLKGFPWDHTGVLTRASYVGNLRFFNRVSNDLRVFKEASRASNNLELRARVFVRTGEGEPEELSLLAVLKLCVKHEKKELLKKLLSEESSRAWMIREIESWKVPNLALLKECRAFVQGEPKELLRGLITLAARRGQRGFSGWLLEELGAPCVKEFTALLIEKGEFYYLDGIPEKEFGVCSLLTLLLKKEKELLERYLERVKPFFNVLLANTAWDEWRGVLRNARYFSSVLDFAIVFSSLEVVYWLYEQGCQLTSCSYTRAIYAGNLELLVWLETMGAPLPTCGWILALAHTRNVKVLQFPALPTLKFEEGVLEERVSSGTVLNPTTFHWLLKRGILVGENLASVVCAQPGIKLLELLEEFHPGIWTPELLIKQVEALSTGQLQWFEKQGYFKPPPATEKPSKTKRKVPMRRVRVGFTKPRNALWLLWKGYREWAERLLGENISTIPSAPKPPEL